LKLHFNTIYSNQFFSMQLSLFV